MSKPWARGQAGIRRQPSKLQIVGSNPIGPASKKFTQERSSNQGVGVKHLVVFGAVCFLILIIATSCTLTASPDSDSSWNKTFGGDENDDYAWSVIQTSDGGYALAGYTEPHGFLTSRSWLIKINPFGSEEWSKTFGNGQRDRAYSAIQTSDGGYALAGYTFSYFWLVKTDSSGNEEWSKTFGGENADLAYSVIQTSDGGYAIAGYTRSHGAGEEDFWLVKTDSSGNGEWNKTFGGENLDWADSVIQTSDGGYVLAGFTRSYGAGGDDFWLVKTDSSGNQEWNKTHGGENDDVAREVIQTSDGGYAIAGYTGSYGAGREDFWLVKTDSSGNMEWSKTFGGQDNDLVISAIQTSDGGYALAGITYSYGAGGGDFWLVKTDSSGNEEWNKTFGGKNYDIARSVIQTSDGGYAIVGSTGSSGDGGYDIWLIKTDSSGNVGEDFLGPEGGEFVYMLVSAIVVVVVALALVLYKRFRG